MKTQQLSIAHIDDNVDMILLVKKLVQKFPNLTYSGGFSDPFLAEASLLANPPNLVFLDIEMPGKDGLALARKLSKAQMGIIFLTAHSGYALEAFGACALNYLLKPLTKDKLIQSIERYRKLTDRDLLVNEKVNELSYLHLTQAQYPRRLFVPSLGKTHVLRLDDLQLIEARSNYSVFTMANGETFISSRNLKIYADMLLHHPDFIRTHRSFIVNKNFIISILRSRNNHYCVVLQNGREVDIVSNKRDAILQQMLH